MSMTFFRGLSVQSVFVRHLIAINLSLSCLYTCGTQEQEFFGPNETVWNTPLSAATGLSDYSTQQLGPLVESTLTKEGLIQIATSNRLMQESITKAHVKFSYCQKEVVATEDFLAGMSRLPPKYSHNVEAAFFGLKQFQYEKKIFEDIEQAAIVYCFDGKSSKIYSNGAGKILKGRSPADIQSFDVFLGQFFLLVLPDLQGEKSDMHEYLPETIPRSKVMGVQTVNGAECVLLQTGDRFFYWIDVSKCIVRRVAWFLPSNGKITLRHLMEYDDVREIAPLVFVPFHCEIKRFLANESRGVPQGNLEIEAKYTVEEFTINSKVPDDVFLFEFPPDTEVNDTVQGRFFVTPSADENIEIIVDKIVKNYRRDQNPFFWYINIALVMLSLFLVGKILYGKK